MGNLSNRAIHSIFGCPTEAETDVIDFDDGVDVVELEANSVYRFAATEDCLITFGDNASVATVTEDGVLVFAGVPEMFSTTGSKVFLSVTRLSTSGALHLTRMITRGN